MLKSSLLYKIINGIWDMCYIWKTEMRNVFRDEGVLIFCILVPLGYPLLYSWIYNNEVVREVDTAIVDLSHSHTSREFIRDYDASPDAKATYYCNSLDEAKATGTEAGRSRNSLYPCPTSTPSLNRGEQAHVGVYCRYESDAHLQGDLSDQLAGRGKPHQFGHSDFDRLAALRIETMR